MRIGVRVGRSGLAVATAAAVLASGGIAAATTVLSDEAIHACLKQSNGELHVVSASARCQKNETALTWNKRGPAGPAGARGLKGDTGPAGPAGAKGEAGPAGPAGPAGEKGEAGAAGAAGDRGPAGEKGDAGPQGEKGDAGPQGEKGDAGPKGDTGAQGDRGPQGDAGPAGKGIDVRTVKIDPGADPVEVPVLGGGRLVLAPWGGGFTCSIDYRNAGDDTQTMMQTGSAPVSVAGGTTKHLGQGYSKQTSPEDRTVIDADGAHGAWFRVAATQRLVGSSLGCVYQVVVAA